MEENQDLFEKLRQIRDSYDPDPDLANRVIEKINQREATVAFKKPKPIPDISSFAVIAMTKISHRPMQNSKSGM